MGDDFLSRWSRLKRRGEAGERASRDHQRPPVEAVAETIATPGSEAEAAEPAGPAEASVAISEEEIAALPPLDSLSEASDLGPFLRAGIPSALRNAALRRMWSLDPSIRDFVSEAREYAYDWNSPGGVPGLGPLLPSDDVKAMVRRIFEGPVRAPDPDAEAAEIAEAEIPEAEAPASEPERPDAPPALARAAPPGGDPDPLAPASRTGAERVHAAGPAVSEPVVKPGVRRHGGALPG